MAEKESHQPTHKAFTVIRREGQDDYWSLRVLTLATGRHRTHSMMEALRKLRVPHSPGAPLFFFTTRDGLRASDPLTHDWRDGNGHAVRLVRAQRRLMPRWLKQCCSAENDVICQKLTIV